ncbi:MAG: hypothetical protein ACI828_001969 [Flavobacteriales bacterium]|jgi:hypothetical protein
MTTTNKPNTWFWVIAVIALLWNLVGLFNFLAATFMKDALAETSTPEELELMNALPSWYFIFFGIATIVGFLACITMLMRKKSTVLLFLISLIAVLVTEAYWLLGTDLLEVMGSIAAVLPIVVIIISILLYVYNKGLRQKEILQ